MLRLRLAGRSAVFLALAIAALALAGAALSGGSAAARSAPAATVALLPPAHARAGDLINVRLVARGAHDLAGYQGAVRFDPAQLRYISAEVSAGFGAAGQEVLPLGPVLRDGAVALGAATCPVAICHASRSVPAAQVLGLDGQVELGVVSFYAAAPGRYRLTLADVRLVDPQGSPLASVTSDTFVDVAAR